MDSLLDEYEENIHKSMTIALRPQRQPSIVSAHHKRLPATHYNRSHYNNQGNLNDDGSTILSYGNPDSTIPSK